MRYKVIFTVSIVLLVLAAVLFESTQTPQNRYHQHLEDRASVASSNFARDAGEKKGEQPEKETEEKPEKEEEEKSEKEEAEKQAKKKERIKNNFSTHLPIVEVATDGPLPGPFYEDPEGIPRRSSETVMATVNYYDNEDTDNLLGKNPTLTEKSTFRIRGRSSRSFDKQSYLMKFRKSNLEDSKHISLSGMDSDNEWALHGPYLDKSLIRNYLSYNISGEIMDFSPNVRFCELFLNGDYRGLYVLTEKAEYSPEGRIGLTVTDPKIPSTSYIVSLDAGEEDTFHSLKTFGYHTEKFAPQNRTSEILEIEYPNKTLTAEQKKFIQEDISQFERTLTSYDATDREVGYENFIDVDSFVDYFIINEFSMNKDAGRLSTYFYKDIRGKMKLAVWDFNSAFNYYATDLSTPHYFVMTNKYWYQYLLKDPDFVEKIISRYAELRESYLSEEYLLNYIDETIAFLGPAIDRNNEIWGYSFEEEHDMLRPTERNPRTYQQAIKQLKKTIVERGDFLDENIEKLRALSHESVNKPDRKEVAN